MSNIVFIILHLAALFMSPLFLFVTIPGHVIFAAIGNKKDIPDYLKYDGMKKCMHCAEYIKNEASICRFCGKEQR